MRPTTVSVLALLLATGASAADRYVTPAGDDTDNDCTNTTSPCATISHAADEAADGDTIRLAAGTWSSGAAYPILLPDGVSVIGSGAGATKLQGAPNLVVDAAPFPGRPLPTDARLLWLNPTLPFEVAGLTIDGSSGSAGRGLVVQASSSSAIIDLLVENLVVQGLDDDAMRVTTDNVAGTDVVIRNVRMEDNRDGVSISISDPPGGILLEGSTLSNNSSDGAEIFVSGSTEVGFGDGTQPDFDIVLRNNTMVENGNNGLELTISDYQTAKVDVSGNTLDGNGDDAFYFYVSSTARVDATISGNTFKDSDGVGFYFSAYDDNTLRLDVVGNTITGNNGDGAYIALTDDANTLDLVFRGNTVSGNAFNGLSVGIEESSYNAVRATIEDNTITDNGFNGIELFNSSETSNVIVADIRSNLIARNDADGVRIHQAYGTLYAELYGNVITDNGENGIHISAATDDGLFVDLSHNTIQDNADGYASTSHYDFDMGENTYQDVLALDNWWGTTDRDTIDDHVRDFLDDDNLAELRYTALPTTLSFAPIPVEGPASGENVVMIEVADGAPPLVPSAGTALLAITFDGDAAQVLEVVEDGSRAFVKPPAHAPGTVDVKVTLPGGQAGTAASAYTYVDDAAVDTNDTDTTGDTDNTGGDDKAVEEEGCGCATSPSSPSGVLWLGIGALAIGLRHRR